MQTTNISSNRLERLNTFLTFAAFTWLVIGIYQLLIGRMDVSLICLIEAAFSVVLVFFDREDIRRLSAQMFLVATTIGLVVQSCMSGLSQSYSSTFFCLVVLIATFLLGPREAWRWTGIALMSIVVVHFFAPPVPPPLPELVAIDRIAGQVTLVFVVLVFSVMAESSAERYARQLQTVSEELNEKTNRLMCLVGKDSLTDLPNRHQFHLDMEQTLIGASQTQERFALLLLDLDGFKEINDLHGHAAGDVVLKDVAVRLQQALASEDCLARLGGDEFTIIAPTADDEVSASLLGGRVLRAISRKYQMFGRDMRLGASIGIAMYPDHGNCCDELLSHADAAMYEAKSRRLGVQVYERRLTEEQRELRKAEEELELAIARDEFALHFQPQVSFRTGHIVGMEALLRWEKGGQVIAPSKFISLLEDSGNIIHVGRWILEQACRHARVWSEHGSETRVAVNVSSVQFRQDTFLDDVWQALEATQVDPSLLDLELTETVFLDRTDVAIDSISALREMGVSVSVDDFGTGYSSLSYLKSLPINRLKIDRSFIKDIPFDDDGMIAETIIALGRNLGMSVLAEGVDTTEQLEFLRDLGCDEYQGFLFSRPLDLAATYKRLGVPLLPCDETGVSHLVVRDPVSG